MRDLGGLNPWRLRGAEVQHWGWEGDGTCGVFRMLSPVDKAPMLIVASCGCGWDHVSVSRRNRCPNWREMQHIHRIFFCEDECAMQLHVPPSDHVNNHDLTLHLWRPQGVPIPRPPAEFV